MLAILLLAACATAPPSGGQPGASASTATQGSPSSAAAWNQIVAAAKKEGSVVVLGQGGSDVATALTAGFASAYPDIRVDFTGANGNEQVTRVLTERAAGQFTTDLMIQGPPNLMELLDGNALDPIPPLLTGPDESPANWPGQTFHYSDNAGQYVLSMLGGTGTVGILNPQLASTSELTSYKDLLDPAWAGKLAMLDPRLPGSAQAEVQFWYVSPDLGKDFVQELFSQGVAVDQDDLALTNAVAQGKYAIGLGLNGYNAVALRNNGVPLDFISSSSMKEGGYLTSSWGAVSLLNRAPHPNAAAVYLNWLLSHDGQQAVAKASGYPSRRQDVSTEGVLDATIPTASTRYIEINQESYVRQRPALVDFLKSLISSS